MMIIMSVIIIITLMVVALERKAFFSRLREKRNQVRPVGVLNDFMVAEQW